MLQPSPQTINLTELQRKPKSVIRRVGKSRAPIFITDRSHVSAVIMNVGFYDKLVKIFHNQEDNFWVQAAGESFSFWDHSSNDVYEKLL